MLRPILVSSCLLGLSTRYDGSDTYSTAVMDFLRRYRLTPVPVCPEQLGGLSTPRPKCWFTGGDGCGVLDGCANVWDEQGTERTREFLQGAHAALRIARLTGCREAILQQRSPSCGTRNIYLDRQLTAGMGVAAALLERSGVRIHGDDRLPTKTLERG